MKFLSGPTSVIFFFLATCINAYSQIPEGYYSTAEGLTEDNLKTALYNIIKGHTEYPYTSTSTDTWDILKESDRDTINPDNVILFYTGWTINGDEEYNSAAGWSREHVWAKSRGDFGTEPGAGTDAHHLRPADISVNSARNNRWFDNCYEQYIDGDGPTDSFTSTTSWVWQPRDVSKGDAARMIFYMATRYEGENGDPDLEIEDYLPADNYTNGPVHAKLSSLLEWNEADPVDDFERNRNNVIYGYQNNRNPYIDHPEYVNMIWGNASATDDIVNRSDILIYPNPACDYVKIGLTEGQTASLLTTKGGLVLCTEKTTLDLAGVLPGNYILVIKDSTGKVVTTRKLIVN